MSNILGPLDLLFTSKVNFIKVLDLIRPMIKFYLFQTSKDKMYKTIYDVMEKNPALLVKSNDEGEKRVITGNGKYAFFMESSNIDYKLKRNCNLKKVGGLLDSKDYGIGLPASKFFVRFAL